MKNEYFGRGLDFKSTIIVALCFIIVLAIIYSLVKIAVFNRQELLKQTFADEQFIYLMNDLIENKVIVYDEGGQEAEIDAEKLALLKLKPAVIKRVMNNLVYVVSINGNTYFDVKKTSIKYSRPELADNLIYKRGSVFDRNRKVIAETLLDERSLKVSRNYPQGESLFHPVGVFSSIYNNRGLEEIYNGVLQKGSDHEPILKKTGDPTRKIIYGDNIKLTLNADLQKKVFEIQKAYKYNSAVVIMDARTAEILVLSSFPSFDPATPVGSQVWQDLTDNKNRSVDNRTLKNYPPGSTFKIIDTIALLESDIREVDEELKIECTGHIRNKKHNVRCIKNHGGINLRSAFIKSCNMYFAAVAMKLGELLNDTAETFGFNKILVLGPEINNKSVFAQASAAFPKNFDYKHNRKIIAAAGIGQNTVEATVVQMSSVVQAIVNRGRLVSPLLIKEIQDANGNILLQGTPQNKQVMKRSTADKVKTFMRLVMTEGTGKNVEKIYRSSSGLYGTEKSANEISVLGKTGTSENLFEDTHPNSWFIGAAPFENPRFVIAVVAENAGWGAAVAAPMAVKMLVESFNIKTR